MKNSLKCIIHCRVSTARQAYEGESLEVQKSICMDIAARHGWTVAHKPWLEAYTGRKSVRPTFDSVLAYLDQHPGQIRFYVFRAIDRFTRGGTGMYERMKAELSLRGVELVDSMGVIQPMRNTLEHVGFEYDWSKVSPSEVAEAVLATTAKAEATTILTRLIGQEIRLTQQGYKVRGPADGYRNERVHVGGKRRVIQVPDPERARFYHLMFELRAAGQLSDPEIVDQLNAQGFRTREKNRWDSTRQRIIGKQGGMRLTVKHYQEIIKRPIYCGVIYEKWTNWRPVRAAYNGLVSIETWNAANRGNRYIREMADGLQLLRNLQGARAFPTKNNPQFQFRHVVVCPECHKPFTGSASTSRNGTRVPAYHCSRGHARVARNKPQFEAAISGYVNELLFEPRTMELVMCSVKNAFDRRHDEIQAVTVDISNHLSELKTKKAGAVRAFLSATSEVMRLALETEVERLECEIKEAEHHHFGATEGLDTTLFDRYVREVRSLMENPGLLLEEPIHPVALRSRYELFFAEPPTLYDIDRRTAKMSYIISLCCRFDEQKSSLVHLHGLNWNTIENDITRWKNIEP